MTHAAHPGPKTPAAPAIIYASVNGSRTYYPAGDISLTPHTGLIGGWEQKDAPNRTAYVRADLAITLSEAAMAAANLLRRALDDYIRCSCVFDKVTGKPDLESASDDDQAFISEMVATINAVLFSATNAIGPLKAEGDANPWVVALTFTVERRNIDEVSE